MKTHTGASFPLPNVAIGFRPELLDFRRGIHVGNVEENERISRPVGGEGGPQGGR
jgi:hypothetical protein